MQKCNQLLASNSQPVTEQKVIADVASQRPH